MHIECKPFAKKQYSIFGHSTYSISLKVYHALSEEDVKKILDFSEKYVMMCCYKLLFCPHSTNDEEKDLEIQNRIR